MSEFIIGHAPKAAEILNAVPPAVVWMPGFAGVVYDDSFRVTPWGGDGRAHADHGVVSKWQTVDAPGKVRIQVEVGLLGQLDVVRNGPFASDE